MENVLGQQVPNTRDISKKANVMVKENIHMKMVMFMKAILIKIEQMA